MESFIIGPMTPWGPFASGFIGLIFAFVLYGLIMKYPAGKDSVMKIGDQIHLGAKVFMFTEYKILAPVVSASDCLWFFATRMVYRDGDCSWRFILSNSWIHWYVFCHAGKC